MLTACLLGSLAEARYSGGSGTAGDPYRIATAADLMALGETPADYDQHFVLTADIDLDPNLPGRKVFDKAVIAPVSLLDVEPYVEGTPFRGVFDGQGHRILHLTIRGTACLGLFGHLDSPAQVWHLRLEEVDVRGEDHIGGLAGVSLGATVTAVGSSGSVSGDWRSIGGLIGYNEWGHITDSHSSADVRGEVQVGGLVGAEMMGSIARCYSTGLVRGDSDGAGGLVGEVSGGSIVGSHSTGVVTGWLHVGGLVGYNYWGFITTSYYDPPAAGDGIFSVTGGEFVGGLVGSTNGSCDIVASYSTGDVNGVSAVGGLVGKTGGASEITASYSRGKVAGKYDVGGLVGASHLVIPPDPNDSRRCFWDIETSGQATSAWGIGKTTREMKDPNTFLTAGWDFETVWMMPAQGYPCLGCEERKYPDSGPWVRRARMKMARDQFAGGVIGDEVFVCGGNAMSGRNLYSGEKYNLTTDTWSDMADNPQYQHPFESWLGLGVEELSGIGCNGKFYVFGAQGGYNDKGVYGGFNYNEMYDPATDRWQTLARKPTTVTGAGIASYGGRIFLFGGSFSSGTDEDEDIYCRTVEAYDPRTDAWQSLRDMPKPLKSMAVAVHGDSAYLVGGYAFDQSELQISSEVMAYNFRTNAWTRNYCRASIDAARVYSFQTTAVPVVNGRAYLIGGFQAESLDTYWTSNAFTILNIESQTWQSGPSLPEPRDTHLTVVSGDTIYVIGGDNGTCATDTVFSYRLPDSLTSKPAGPSGAKGATP